jgi:hypothetical protein
MEHLLRCLDHILSVQAWGDTGEIYGTPELHVFVLIRRKGPSEPSVYSHPDCLSIEPSRSETPRHRRRDQSAIPGTSIERPYSSAIHPRSVHFHSGVNTRPVPETCYPRRQFVWKD